MSEDDNFQIEFYEGILRRDGNDITVLELLASLYTKVGRIDEGLALDERNVRLNPENPTSHYNLACSLALKNRRDEALRHLKTALEKGFKDTDWILKDPDFKSLHDDGDFLKLLEEFAVKQ